MTASLLSVRNLTVRYPIGRRGLLGASRTLEAVAGVSLELMPGGSLGVVGESGSGKSTLARAVLGFVRPAAGEIHWCGERIDTAGPSRWRALRRELQVVFQDPFGSLDPRMTVGASVFEALEALEGLTSAAASQSRIAGAFEEVGLDPALAGRYPHELSGGQCQRVAIARATIVRPRLLVCDEAVSALDVSVQAQIVNLLRDLSGRHGMALLFISHNLAVVRHLCDHVAVLQRGRLVEQGDRQAIFGAPQSQYTRDLLAAVPRIDRQAVE
jgi:ABC-type glutathione transport system ATPase component